MSIESILSSQERTCPECERQFIINSQWVYRLIIKGQTIWYCRYNCVRAGERKLKEAKKVIKKKPKKQALEQDLKAGMTGPQIAEKYDCSNATVHNWIKVYGLQELQAVRKPKNESVVIQSSPPVDMVQESPTMAEVEQFHTDERTVELPKVEIADSESLGEAFIKITCGGVKVDKPITDVAVSNSESIQSSDPVPAPEITLEDGWSEVYDKIVTQKQRYVNQAEKTFREKLRGLLADVIGEGLG